MAPCVCYIGRVEEVDEYGVLINESRWDDELDIIHVQTEDLYLPWSSVNAMLVCTPQQPERRFLRDRAPEWRAAIEAMYEFKE